MVKKKLVVIGGGAAGFFCAVNAARLYPGLEVILLERTSKLLSKVKVSGGGRCNVTHACFSIADMIKKYPRGSAFLKKAFHHFFITDTIAWFRDRNINLKTESDGRMFPVTDSSLTIIDCLLNEAAKCNVKIEMNAVVNALYKKQQGWELQLADKTIHADLVCIATGGFAKPEQFNWIKAIGHSIEDPVPSLFTFNIPRNNITALMGITVEHVAIKIAGTKLQEFGPLLITHWGLSGPAVLKLSAWGARELASRNYAFNIIVNWLPAYNEITLKEKMQQVRFDIAAQKIINRNPFGIAGRLWQYFLEQAGIVPEMRWADLPAKEQNKLVKILCAEEFAVKGKTTFKEEFVTAGGVQLSEIDVNTMQSKIAPGIFFAGEIMDVDGVTGGFNFQHAWTSGWIAAEGIVKNLRLEVGASNLKH
ncbi:NAD(P)/FAD-dependent oxidoreductase [soil metagenome]